MNKKSLPPFSPERYRKPVKTLGTPVLTHNEFHHLDFPDSYGAACHMQASSIILEEVNPGAYENPGTSAIWLGIRRPELSVMAINAAKCGVQTDETTGWVPYPIPPEVLISSTMLLDRHQVEALINHLRAWLDTGSFAVEGGAE